MTPAFACSRTARRSARDDEVRKTAILTRETPRVDPRPALRPGHRQRDPAGPDGAAAGRRAGIARVRADPLPGRAVRLPVADRRRPVADRRRLRGGRAHARPRSARRCTAATNSRSRSGSSRCGCWRRCSATTRRRARRPRTSCGAGDVLVAGAGGRRARDAPHRRPGGRARRRPSARASGSRWTSSAARSRAATRSAPSHADHGVLIVALTERAAASPTSPAAPRRRSTRPSPTRPRGDRLQRASASTCATPTARTSTPGWRCGSPARCPSMARLLVGKVSAPTGCWPAPPRRRTPAN